MVVPPASAAAWPDAKSSTVTAPMKGMSRCVCGSMPPGMTSSPVALSTRAPGGALRPRPTAAIRPPSSSTSAANWRSALTTVPPAMKTGCGGHGGESARALSEKAVRRSGAKRARRRRTRLHLACARRGGGGGRDAEQRGERERRSACATPRGVRRRAHVATQSRARRQEGVRKNVRRTKVSRTHGTHVQNGNGRWVHAASGRTSASRARLRS